MRDKAVRLFTTKPYKNRTTIERPVEKFYRVVDNLRRNKISSWRGYTFKIPYIPILTTRMAKTRWDTQDDRLPEEGRWFKLPSCNSKTWLVTSPIAVIIGSAFCSIILSYTVSAKVLHDIMMSKLSMSSLRNTLASRGVVTPTLGQYGYVPRKSPPCLTLVAPKYSTFSTCAARKDPPFFKKIYVSLLFLAPKPLFSRVGKFWKPLPPPLPFSVRGRSLSPLFLNPPWHIPVYTTFIFEYPPGLSTTLE